MKKHSGFTLLEMMVALAIFSIIGINIMNVVSEQLIWTHNLNKKIISSWLADNILAEIEIMNIKQSEKWLKGRDGMASLQRYWRSKEIISKTESVGIIIIELREHEGDGPPDFSFTGYRITNG
ncbi:MAG: type II secretion system minor pseudopilin GspI [Yersinia sp. (in: enterobacteria)]